MDSSLQAIPASASTAATARVRFYSDDHFVLFVQFCILGLTRAPLAPCGIADVEVHSTEEEEDCGGNEDGLEEIRLEAVLLVAVGASTNKATWQQRKVA